MNLARAASPELVRLFDSGSMTGLTDWQLLERFVNDRDELAFETLVALHGPMVMGVCRRLLGNSPEADDAFQATFVVLLRRARSLGPADTLGGWLHGVALRVARQARGIAFRRGLRERSGVPIEAHAACVGSDSDKPDLREVLDQELERLPSKYRLPVILCYLEGQTHEDAARQLQWPLGTVKGRLSRARALLQSRLARRGVAGAGVSAVGSWAVGSLCEAAVPAALLQQIHGIASHGHAASRTASFVTTPVSRLVQGVLTTMIFQKLRLVALSVAVSGLFLAGAGVLARQDSEKTARPEGDSYVRQKEVPAVVAKPAAKKIEERPPAENSEPSADPAELAREARNATNLAYQAAKSLYRQGHGTAEQVHAASTLVVEAETDPTALPEARARALEGHVERMRELARIGEETGIGIQVGTADAQAFFALARLQALRSKASLTDRRDHLTPGPAREAAPSPREGPGHDAKSQAILAKLEQPITMSFPNETPLEDVLKYIKQASQGANDAIQIYVDPEALRETDKTMTSPVSIDLDGVPLRRSLQLVLSQLGLAYFVDDGILVITSEDSEQVQLRPSQLEQSPFRKKRERAERGEMTAQELKQFLEELMTRKEMFNALNDLETKNELGYRGQPAPPRAEAAEPVLKEVKALLEELKAERTKARL